MRRMSLLVFGVGWLACAANAVPPVIDGLVAAYEFNGNAADVSGSGNDGFVYGASLATDRFGNANSAYCFNGFDDYITVADSPALRMQEDFTVSCWLNSAQGARGKVLGKNGNMGTSNYTLMVDEHEMRSGVIFQFENQHDFDYGVLMDGHPAISREPNYIGADTYIDQEEWVLAAFTKDGDQFNFYLDGKLVSSVDWSFSEAAGSQNLNIGTGSGEYNTDYFQGMIDDVYIYNRALSGTEIHKIYTAVPEPSSIALLLVSGVGVFLARSKFGWS